VCRTDQFASSLFSKIIMRAPERRNGEVGLHCMEGAASRFTKLTMVLLIVLAPLTAQGLNVDGNALLDFQHGITSSPQNSFQSWNPSDATPCSWTGVTCTTIQGLPEQRVAELNLFGYESPPLPNQINCSSK
jgi:hypothetical protein